MHCVVSDHAHTVERLLESDRHLTAAPICSSRSRLHSSRSRRASERRELSGDFTQSSGRARDRARRKPSEHGLRAARGARHVAPAGALEVELTPGYLPSPGDVFEVLLAGSLVGEFESYAGLDLGGGLYLVPEYRPDSPALRAVPEPTTGALVAAGLLAFTAARQRV